MLTLGLMEGVLSATVGILILVAMADGNAPLHRIFGPLVVVVVGSAAYGIHASGTVEAASDVVGLALFAFIAFFAPLGIMRAGWKVVREMNRQTVPPARRATAPVRAVETLVFEEAEPRKVA